MSVSAKRKRAMGVVAAVASMCTTTAVLVSADQDSLPPETTDAVAFLRPSRALEVIEKGGPVSSSIAVSQRLFGRSDAVFLVGQDDDEAIRLAAESGVNIPVLVEGAGVADEILRLGAERVLAIGTSSGAADHIAVEPSEAGVAAAVADLPRELRASERPRSPTMVITRSKAHHAAAVTTATHAGATVIQIADADPRTSPRAAKTLAERATDPVIALGPHFVKNFKYQLAVVRDGRQQPGGGFLAFPGRHMIALYGHPGSGALGVLGEQGVKASIKRAKSLAAKYRPFTKKPVVPTFEIIATVASASAGKDKNYSAEASIKTLKPLINAAEKAGVYVIIDLQPGRTDFITQARRYKSLLRRPHVGLALDPEWRLKSDQKHLVQIGSVGIAEVNRVSDWLAKLTRRHTLPQKVFVLHQFSITMIRDRSRLHTGHAELATLIHVDGQGSQGAKQGTWRFLRQDAPPVFWGWKNFYDEDEPTLTPSQTWKQVSPHPELISYQ